MAVRVRLFAGLRERAGWSERELDGAATVGDVWPALGLGEEPAGLLYAVNKEYADHSRRLADGDEVAVIPPVSGGAFRLNSEPLSLLMFDIDHFKSFNDSYGHLTGDQVLRLVGLSLKQTIKGQDITARYGGEEFGVVLPNTALRQALTVADHIRRAVMSKELKKKSTGEILGRVTISVGVSMLKPGDDTDSLIERADACLYAAKRNGRNRVICEADPEYAAETQSQVA